MSYQPPISFNTYGANSNKKQEVDLLGLGYSSTQVPSTVVKKNDTLSNRKKGSSALYDPDDIIFSFGNNQPSNSKLKSTHKDFDELEEIDMFKENTSLLGKGNQQQSNSAAGSNQYKSKQ